MQRPRVRIVDRLAKNPFPVGDERCDHIHELREASDAHAIRMSQERVDEPTDEQCVLEIVDFLEQMRGLLSLAVAASRAIPDIPLIEGKRQALAGFPQTAHVIANGGYFLDLLLHVEIQSQIAAAIAIGLAGVAVVAMERDVIDLVVTLLENLAIPFQVSRHSRTTRPASN